MNNEYIPFYVEELDIHIGIKFHFSNDNLELEIISDSKYSNEEITPYVLEYIEKINNETQEDIININQLPIETQKEILDLYFKGT